MLKKRTKHATQNELEKMYCSCYLTMQELRLRSSPSLDIIAQLVKKGHGVLLLVETLEVAQDFGGPRCTKHKKEKTCEAKWYGVRSRVTNSTLSSIRRLRQLK